MADEFQLAFTEEEIKEIISSIENAPIEGYGNIDRNKRIYTIPYIKLIKLLDSKLNHLIKEKVNRSGDTMTGSLEVESGEEGTKTKTSGAGFQADQVGKRAQYMANGIWFGDTDGFGQTIQYPRDSVGNPKGGTFALDEDLQEAKEVANRGDSVSKENASAISNLNLRLRTTESALSGAKESISKNASAIATNASAIESNAKKIDTNASDITNLREDFVREAHFKGWFETSDDLPTFDQGANANDYAYVVDENGEVAGYIWIYEDGLGWKNTEQTVPNSAVPAYDGTPRMNGTAQPGIEAYYSRGDHVHPTDTSRASATEFNAFKNSKGQPDGIASLNEEGQVPSEQLPSLDYLPLSGGELSGPVTIKSSTLASTQFGIGGVSYKTAEKTVAFNYPLNKTGGQTFAMLSDLEGLTSGDYGDLSYIQAQIAVINQALLQSGLTFTADDVNTWSDRVTANGGNIVDGSFAVLKKVEGSTVASKNLVGIPAITTETPETEIEVKFIKNIFVSAGELATVSTSVWRLGFEFADGTRLYALDGELANGGKMIEATADNPIVKIEYRSVYITSGQYSKIMIEYGDTATEYRPYFTGLKSASFGGIESTSKNLYDKAYGNNHDSWNMADYYYLPIYVGAGNTVTLSIHKTYPETATTVKICVATNETDKGTANGMELPIPTEENALPTSVTVAATSDYIWLNVVTEDPYAGRGAFQAYISDFLQIEKGEVATDYAPYEISAIALPEPIKCGLGTTIDFENQKIVDYGVEVELTGEEIWVLNAQADTSGWGNVYQLGVGSARANTGILPVSTDFAATRWGAYFADLHDVCAVSSAVILIKTDGVQTLDEFKDYLAQRYADGNPVTIRYVSADLQSKTPFTDEQKAAGDEYTAYLKGRETVQNDSAEYGATVTLTINYLYVTGGTEA